METNQKYINDYKNIISIDSNNNLNDNIDENNSSFKITQKNGEIEMIINEPYIDYDNLNNNENDNDNDNDNLSEFSQYRDHDFESDDDLECSLDSTLEFIFDFDIIYKPENNIKLFEIIKFKNIIQNIKKLNDNDKFDLI